jgi:hypothetical protein
MKTYAADLNKKMLKAWKLVIHVYTNEHKIIAQMQCKTIKMKNAELYKFHISFLFRTNIFCRVILYWQNIYSNTFKSLFYCKYFFCSTNIQCTLFNILEVSISSTMAMQPRTNWVIFSNKNTQMYTYKYFVRLGTDSGF